VPVIGQTRTQNSINQLTTITFLYSCHVLHTFIPDIYLAPLQEIYSEEIYDM